MMDYTCKACGARFQTDGLVEHSKTCDGPYVPDLKSRESERRPRSEPQEVKKAVMP